MTLPICQERATSKPTLYVYTKPFGLQEYITRRHLSLLCYDRYYETVKFQRVKNKA
ncbi:MAG: hypothetical protein IKP73_00695 [Bacteroidales bacterium]|nr:hypothetical protein [Bacteroidales bacterium]